VSPLKIFNDPVHGFIEVPKNILLQVIDHPYFQRLRRIRQAGLSSLIYPGSVHTRFNHALGAMHLTKQALDLLRKKDIEITEEEYTATLLAILLHDIGHGPFSHALENVLIPELKHEQMSLLLMEHLNIAFNGQLTLAIQIFTGQNPKTFLHQLISGQLDMDRMDYLMRDSFFTGVIEGVIGTDRIIKTLNVHNNRLVVEEKGIYAIEKFIIARRLMYWQVYLHKTSIIAEHMIIKTLQRAKEIYRTDPTKIWLDDNLTFFLDESFNHCNHPQLLQRFNALDDSDILYALKRWQGASDRVLAELCERIINRRLLKIRLSKQAIDPNEMQDQINNYTQKTGLTQTEASYLIFTGKVSNRAYLPLSDEPILILMKDGTIRDLAHASDLMELQSVAQVVTKYFLISPEVI